MTLLMRTGGVTKIILCADHFYNKIIACFCAILRIYAPSLEESRDAFRHEKTRKKTKSWKKVAENLAEFQEFSVFLDRVLPLPKIKL